MEVKRMISSRGYKKMSYKIKRVLKKSLRAGIYGIVSLQLCCISPYYIPFASAQVAPPPNGEGGGNNEPQPPQDPISNFFDQIQRHHPDNNFVDRERIEQINELAAAIDTGNVKEYLDRNARMEGIDHFLLADQRVEAVEYHFDSEKGDYVEAVTGRVHLNDYKTTPVHAVFKSIRVRYDEKNRQLIFEGISEDTVRLRQYVPNLDVISYANDNEMLIILDKNKGLIVVDMFFARAFLGLAPVPFYKVPFVKLAQLTAAARPNSRIETDSLKLEFVGRTVSPPDVVPESIQSIEKNFQGDSLFQAGDFMMSHTDEKGQKHLIMFLKRWELSHFIQLSYDILDIMVRTVAAYLLEGENLNEYGGKINRTFERTGEPGVFLENVMSSLYTKKTLYKFAQVIDSMEQRQKQLGDDMSPRDTMLLAEWREAYNDTSSRLMTMLTQEERETQKVKELTEGARLSTEEIAHLDQELRQKHEKVKLSAEEMADLNRTMWEKKFGSKKKEDKIPLAKRLKRMGAAIKTFKLSTHRVTYGAAGAFTVAGYVGYEQFILLANYVFHFFNNMGYVQNFSVNQFTIIPNWVILGVLIPVLLFLAVGASLPVAEFVDKRNILPDKFSLLNRVYHPRGWLKDFLVKWGDTNISQRFVGLGMKMVAILINPFYKGLAAVIGQPHFFAALQKGLKPGTIIKADSDIGRIIGLTKDTKLGTQGLWNYHAPFQFLRSQKKEEEFKEQRQLQNAAMAKEQLMKTVAWLMANLAVAGREQISTEEVLLWTSTRMRVNEIRDGVNTEELRIEATWVMENLLREMEKINNIDISQELSELSLEQVLHYYEKAKELVEEVRGHTDFRKKVRKILNTGLIYEVRRRLTGEYIANFNKDYIDVLQKVPVELVEQRVIKGAVTDHGLIMGVPSLMTERADPSLENINQLAVSDKGMMRAGEAHAYEVYLNAIMQLFIGGAQMMRIFGNKGQVLDKMNEEQRAIYESMDKYVHKINEHTQKEESYYWKQLKYHFAGGGKPGNWGEIMTKRALPSWIQSLQMGLLLGVGGRMLLTPQSFIHAVAGAVLMRLGADFTFNWPWYSVAGAENQMKGEFAKNQKKMEDLLLKLSGIERGFYTQEGDMRRDYEEALMEMVELYNHKKNKKDKTLRKNKALQIVRQMNPELASYLTNRIQGQEVEFPSRFSENLGEIKQISDNLRTLLTTEPPLPNTMNRWASWMTTATVCALLSNILFVALAMTTFRPENFTMAFFTKLTVSAGFGYWAWYKIFSRGITGHWKARKRFMTGLAAVNFLALPAGLMYFSPELQRGIITPEWGVNSLIEYIIGTNLSYALLHGGYSNIIKPNWSAMKKRENWKKYFYEGILEMKSVVGRGAFYCKEAFRSRFVR